MKTVTQKKKKSIKRIIPVYYIVVSAYNNSNNNNILLFIALDQINSKLHYNSLQDRPGPRLFSSKITTIIIYAVINITRGLGLTTLSLHAYKTALMSERYYVLVSFHPIFQLMCQVKERYTLLWYIVIFINTTCAML